MRDSTKKMLGLQELKEKIEITPTTVECPVNDCPVVVERQHQHFRKENRFRCSTHNIYISPSTFEYQNYNDNLLWKDPEDIKLLESIFKEKRESRMARDNSEDAVTWNVFRYLEKNNLIEGFLSQLTGTKQENAEVIYWSYSQREGHAWTCLNKGREEFGEEEGRGSEPDIIVKTDKTLFFIEAKLTSGNQTTPSVKNNSKKYETGGNNWFKEVFNTNYKTIAITEKKYELMRFWLLGTWMAEQACPRFYLINLVREQQEEGIEPVFKRHIKESLQRKFFRVTWESIYKYVSERSEVNDKVLMIRFFENKTIGYKNGTLQKAFSINPRD
jgi:hypothetical protein